MPRSVLDVITTANDEPLAVIAEDVVDELGSFLKDVKLHDDAAKPCMILQERLHYN